MLQGINCIRQSSLIACGFLLYFSRLHFYLAVCIAYNKKNKDQFEHVWKKNNYPTRCITSVMCSNNLIL